MRKISKTVSVYSATLEKKAGDRLPRDLFFKQVDEAYKRLKRDKKAWAEELRERAEWEAVNDLDDDE